MVPTALATNGLRAWSTSGGTTTYYLYDGAMPACELSATGTVVETNTFGANGLISRSLNDTDHVATTVYAFDNQGNVTQRLNASGAVLSTDAYDAWGNPLGTASGDVFGYNGQAGYYTDSATGLILCSHRFYDPSRGRWLTRDPIGYAGGVNLYGYAGNGPTVWVDPNGTAFWWNPSPQTLRAMYTAFTGAAAVFQQVTAPIHGEPFRFSAPTEPTISQPFTREPPEGELGDGGMEPPSAVENGIGEGVSKAAAADSADAAVGTTITAGSVATVAALAVVIYWSGHEMNNYRPGHPVGPLTGLGEWLSNTRVGTAFINSFGPPDDDGSPPLDPCDFE